VFGLAASGAAILLATGCGKSVSSGEPPVFTESPSPSPSPAWHLPDACALLDPSVGRAIVGDPVVEARVAAGECSWKAEGDPASTIRIVASEGFAETGERNLERNTAVIRERYDEADADDCAPLPVSTACWVPPSRGGMLIVHAVREDVMVSFIARGSRISSASDTAARRLAEQAAASILSRLLSPACHRLRSAPVTESPVPGLDTTRPHPARMYDYYLGGKDNFAVDREAAEQIIKLSADTPLVARQNRAFMRRATAAVAATGVRQFLDLGSGLPTADNLHQVAQRIAPGTRVVYVDNDPIVLAHGRALLADDDSTTVLTADLQDPDKVWSQVEETGLLDLEQPVGLMVVSVLHFVPGDLKDLIRAYLDRLAPGSHLALTHVCDEGMDPRGAEQAADVYRRTPTGLYVRSPREIEALFADTRLLDPGVVPTRLWRPDPSSGDDDRPTFPVVLGGVGLLP